MFPHTSENVSLSRDYVMAAKKPDQVIYFEDLFMALGPVETKRFFGGWQFSIGGKQFAGYMRSTLYFRVDTNLAAALQDAGSEPFWYDRRDRRVIVNAYQSAPESALDDDEELLRWAALVIGIA
jgi:DNA transformation protein and related proteins